MEPDVEKSLHYFNQLCVEWDRIKLELEKASNIDGALDKKFIVYLQESSFIDHNISFEMDDYVQGQVVLVKSKLDNLIKEINSQNSNVKEIYINCLEQSKEIEDIKTNLEEKKFFPTLILFNTMFGIFFASCLTLASVDLSTDQNLFSVFLSFIGNAGSMAILITLVDISISKSPNKYLPTFKNSYHNRKPLMVITIIGAVVIFLILPSAMTIAQGFTLTGCRDDGLVLNNTTTTATPCTNETNILKLEEQTQVEFVIYNCHSIYSYSNTTIGNCECSSCIGGVITLMIIRGSVLIVFVVLFIVFICLTCCSLNKFKKKQARTKSQESLKSKQPTYSNIIDIIQPTTDQDLILEEKQTIADQNLNQVQPFTYSDDDDKLEVGIITTELRNRVSSTNSRNSTSSESISSLIEDDKKIN